MDKDTKKEWLNWINRAISDYKSAKKLFSGKNKILGATVFHCQQSVEKILNSFLVYKEIKFERVHNIVYLLDKCVNINESFQKWYVVAESITPYATLFRYPGDFDEPEIDDVKEALANSKEIINFVLDIYIINKDYSGERL
jgi:HEPN domain-containing protein